MCSAYLKLNPQPNEWVFIHGGSGGVGTALCQICAQSKCKTVASTSISVDLSSQSVGNPSNIAKLKNIGVDEVCLVEYCHAIGCASQPEGPHGEGSGPHWRYVNTSDNGVILRWSKIHP